MSSIRLDQYLADNNLVTSRSQAKDLINRQKILVNGKPATKVAQKVTDTDQIKVLEKQFVGRGAHKLQAALNDFQLSAQGLVAIDLGASTGGFTEILLNDGAVKVYCVDVGHDQLDPKLIADTRVVNLEKTHVKDAVDLVEEKIDLIVCDLSFISLSGIFEIIANFYQGHTKGIFLIKPQFELDPKKIGKGGIVRDESAHQEAVERFQNAVEKLGFQVDKVMASPIKGKSGNKEFLALVTKA